MHTFIYKTTFSIVITLSLTVSCYAQLSPETSDTTITIEAHALSSDEQNESSTGQVEIITADSYGSKNLSIAALISKSSSVHIKRHGSRGSQSYASIRGSNSNQLLILIDGVPITDSLYAEVNLENISTADIERIEIYKGVTPLKFGANGLAGAINIVTKTQTAQKKNYAQNNLKLGYGSFHTIHTSLRRFEKFDTFDYTLLVSRDSSSGDFEFLNDNGTPTINQADDKTEKRKNNFFESYTGKAKIGYDFSLVTVSLANSLFYKKNGIAGLNSNSVSTASFETLHNTTLLRCDFANLTSGTVQSALDLYFIYQQDTFDDPAHEISLIGEQQQGTFKRFGTSSSTELLLPQLYQTITLLLSAQKESYLSESIQDKISSTSPEQQRHSFNLGLGDELALFNDHLLISPDIRYIITNDDYTIERNLNGNSQQNQSQTKYALNWHGGAKLFFFRRTKRAMALFSNISVNNRRPTFAELFGNSGNLLGSPELKDEQSLNRDLGIEARLTTDGILSELFTNYTFFYNTIDNIILYIQNSQNTMLAQNISSAQVYGHEFSLKSLMFNFIELNCAYTYQHSQDTSSIPHYKNKQLPHRPKHELVAGSALVFKKLTLEYNFELMGSNYLDRANSEFYFIEKRVYHNISLLLTPIDHLSFSLECTNIGDEKSRDLIGYPLPGRSFFIATEYSF